MTQSKLIIVSLGALIFLSLINIFYKGSFYESWFLDVNGSIFEPVLVIITFLFLTSLITFKINKNLFKKWFQKFFIWYFPLTLLLTFAFPTSGYTMIHRFDAAVLFGMVMVVVTLGIVGYSLYRGRG